MNKKKYKNIVDHYESCFKKFGDNHKGIDAPNLPDHLKRYEVTLQVIHDRKDDLSILDFGCGTAMLFDYIQQTKWNSIIQHYSGLDIGDSYYQHCLKKHPSLKFYNLDILDQSSELPHFDYIVMQGVFTEKRELDFDEMWEYFTEMLKAVFAKAEIGIAFNVMAKAVDWERDDLFHVPTDKLILFLTKNLSRHFIIRNDYGLYEYTVYVYKKPSIEDLS
jgi:hypothetical protein